MNRVEQNLAARYAQAFLNTVGKDLALQDYQAALHLYEYLKEHANLILYFRLPHMYEVKKEALHTLLQSFSLPTVFEKITDLLLEHQRTFLIKDFLGAFLALYRKKHGIVFFTLKSSHELSAEHKAELLRFIERKTGKTVLCKTVIDKNLIAGIRLLSSTLLWEYSVNKTLRDARLALRS
ncbi:MAG: FoF1 ATP synthase subunit delta [Candidatus Babeliales bacterium]